MHRPTKADVGKVVVNHAGQSIGRVCDVKDGAAIVDTNPGVPDSIKGRLGWDEPPESEYRLDGAQIYRVTGEEIRLG